MIRFLVVGFIVLFFGLPVFPHYSILKSDSGMKAIEYLPKGFDADQDYSVLVVLHGLRETMYTSYHRWQKVADTLNMVLLCPEGSDYNQAFLRSPVDDLASVELLSRTIQKKYGIRPKKTFLVGFSRGGNISIELGMRYPETFPNIVSFFGFFNDSNVKRLYSRLDPKQYRSSQFVLVTGRGDLTETSVKRGTQFFEERDISVYMWRYQNLWHALPENLKETMGRIQHTFQKRVPLILDSNRSSS